MEYCVDLIALRKLMIDNGINTQQELAVKSGISVKTVNGIMTGKITPSVSVMYKIADCLGLDPETSGRTFFASKLA
jgi:transcriptional regulator with XRE-family HTH domain